MAAEIVLTPIGFVHSAVREMIDDVFGGVVARIELDSSRFTADCLAGLAEFSHVEIVFALDRVPDEKIQFGASHPRGRLDWPRVGIFAQRGKHRPNRIGVTVCRLVAVHDLAVEVESLDAIDGTPVLDIKPYVVEFGPRGPVRQPPWASELMAGYWNKG
jgi:tRNA-Thr(GGU) m(6)t(6)A37 methyltransferase TsaA